MQSQLDKEATKRRRRLTRKIVLLIQVQELTCTTLATELLELKTVAIFGLQVARVAGEVSRSTSKARAKGPDVSSVKSPFFVSGEHECFSSELRRFEGFLYFGRPACVRCLRHSRDMRPIRFCGKRVAGLWSRLLASGCSTASQSSQYLFWQAIYRGL